MESGDRHEVCSECNNNNDGRGAILQGYKAESIVKSSENGIRLGIKLQVLHKLNSRIKMND